MTNIINKNTERPTISITEAEKVIKALSEIFRESLSNGDSIAIPGFGTFMAIKNEEKIIQDTVTGNPTLIPPCIEISFIPALKLVKSVKNASIINP